MASEYIIYADESIKKGEYYSNFYGGVLIRSRDIDMVRSQLASVKVSQNLYNEIKWSKVSSQYLEKYLIVINRFFDFVANDVIKVRIMFTQNHYVAQNLEQYHREHEYFLLYYQFIKHAFGLQYSNDGAVPVDVRIYLDRLPDQKEKVAQFRSFLVGLNREPKMRRAAVRIREDQITEVDSHKHDVLQCLDIVLGSMQFRLNDRHLAKPEGSFRRGKKTVAKEKLYKHILRRIRTIYPLFNIGISTGIADNQVDLWRHPYRHWLFRPKRFEIDSSRGKQ